MFQFYQEWYPKMTIQKGDKHKWYASPKSKDSFKISEVLDVEYEGEEQVIIHQIDDAVKRCPVLYYRRYTHLPSEPMMFHLMLILIAVLSCMRFSDVLEFVEKIKNPEFVAQVLRTLTVYYHPSKTKKKLVTLPVSDRLAWLIQHQSKGKIVKKGGTRYRYFKVISELCNVPYEKLGMHKMKHSFVTQALDSGIDTHLVMLMAGHTSLEMTTNYTHLSQKGIEKARQIMNNQAS